MKKLCRFFVLVSLAFTLLLPFSKSHVVQASDIVYMSPGQTYKEMYYTLFDAEKKYTDPSRIDFVSENPEILSITDIKAGDALGTGKERFFPIFYTVNTKASGDAKIDLYYDGKPVQKNLFSHVVRNYMWRMYNPNSGEHFYTSLLKESDHLFDLGWKDEGIGWYAPDHGDPVYRLYNKNAGEHHYTLSEKEKNFLIKAGWKSEGIGWYSDPNQGVKVYRVYNPNAFANNHHYTTNVKERDTLVSLGWKNEGIAWYGVEKNSAHSVQP